MNDVLVVEIRLWLLLVLLFVIAVTVGVAAVLTINILRNRSEDMRQKAVEENERENMVRRNRMFIRLDHELKNPLTAVRASSATLRELVHDPSVSPQEIGATLDSMDSASRRVARLLADLRRLADVETRRIDFARVDMEGLLHQAVEDARTAPGAEGRTIVANVARAPWRLPGVAGEEDLLLSAVLNLLSNAVKFSGPADVVELRANEQVLDEHRWVIVEVADTGVGIPAAEQASVLDELARGENIRGVSGSGMGLALVKTIVDRHGGKLELYSQENVGTAVRIVLPALPEAHHAPMDARHLQRPGAAVQARPVGSYQDVHQQRVAAPGPPRPPVGLGPGIAARPDTRYAHQHAPMARPPGQQTGSGPLPPPQQRLNPEASEPTMPHPMGQLDRSAMTGSGPRPPAPSSRPPAPSARPPAPPAFPPAPPAFPPASPPGPLGAFTGSAPSAAIGSAPHVGSGPVGEHGAPGSPSMGTPRRSSRRRYEGEEGAGT